ncbi:hypothetical protein C5167_012318 [Papaver somniferum]|uniref:SAP domain-containing protein n=1 Tax=Papaver somniferum TaxID=3469 RepID=A0A4Y7IXZ2_PAPSO|nr:hypothetical protein C5167_012318 [Papaver somniferum]
MDENRWSVGETEFKVYLTKIGLGLTGEKNVLMDRIKEHFGIINGGRKQKYQVTSFVYNCKDTQHQFNARESDCGFTSFMPLSELYDPSRKFLATIQVQHELSTSERTYTIWPQLRMICHVEAFLWLCKTYFTSFNTVTTVLQLKS